MTSFSPDPTTAIAVQQNRRPRMGARSRTSALERWLRALVILACAMVLIMVAVEGVAAESPSPAVDGSPAASPVATGAPVATGSPAATAAPTEEPSGTAQPDLDLAEGDGCYNCHVRIDGEQHTISDQWFNSVHGAEVGCAECHGGDPTSDQVTVAMDPANGFQGIPSRRDSVEICGSCHSDVERMRQFQIPTDQYAKYRASVHGEKLVFENDTRVALCTDCHGVHDIKKASDPSSKVYPLNVPDLCASCHSSADYMQDYDIPTNQFDVYSESVHGEKLLLERDLRAPTCASCHGSHDAKPPQSTQVVDVCGKCHTATQALYEESRHAELDYGPKCWTCHGAHDIVQPTEARFFHPEPPQIECSTCHNPSTQQLKLDVVRFQSDDDRRCDTCHHPDSLLHAQAEGILAALKRAADAYDTALAKIEEAAAAGMIVTDADVLVTQARTSLIQARAATHTTKLTDVASKADASVEKAEEAAAFADGQLQESLFRRQAMIVVIVLIAVTVVALMLLRRELDHSYEKS